MRAIIFLLVGLLVTTCSSSKKESVTELPVANELPALQLTLLNGEKLLVDSLPGSTVLFFFSPDCDHCQREAEDIREHLKAFNDYNIYFIAAHDSGQIEAFSKKYRLSGIPNIVFAHAEVPDVVKVMGSIGTPTLYIYSERKQLVKKFENETDVEEIIKFL